MIEYNPVLKTRQGPCPAGCGHVVTESPTAWHCYTCGYHFNKVPDPTYPNADRDALANARERYERRVAASVG